MYRLDNRVLWEDETITANLAVNILKYGIPGGDDGTNRLLFNSAADLNKDSVWVYSPWLSEYLTAASFAVFGKNEFAARLPFAVLGFLSVIFLFYVVLDIFKDKQLALITLLLSITSEVLILHSRQCKYYTIAIFMQILFIYAFHLLIGRKRVGIVCMAIALTAQFYSNYMFVPGNMLLAMAAAFMLRKKYPGLLFDLFIASGIVSVFALAWVLYAALWNQAGLVGLSSYYEKLIFYLIEINMTMFPLLLLLLPVFFRKSEFIINAGSKEMLFFIIAIIPFQLSFTINFYLFFIRYIIVLIPVFIILQALILRKTPFLLRYTLLCVLCFTNVIGYAAVLPFKNLLIPHTRLELQKLRFPVKDILIERLTPYVNRSEELIAFLNENAQPGQTLLAQDSEFPVIFYTKLKVLDINYIKTQPSEFPDWIFTQSVSGINEYLGGKSFDTGAYSEFLRQNYVPVIIKVHNSKVGGSIPDPDLYEYVTSANKIQFLVFKKKPR
ncbi:MAG: glycosyltransferase family 39 protein [Nitrospirae bacterium YQR-1]